MGVAVYNQHCRSIVTRYTKEWEVTVNRLGRWIDFEKDYKTMDPWFMESVWWVFKTMFDKGLVYMGYKVMPYSTACSTPLSNFEAGLNYKDVRDPAIVVSFPVLGEQDTHFVAWTTTPWTLPSNLGLCVNADLPYLKIKDVKSGRFYYICETRLPQLYPIMDTKKWKPAKAGEYYEVLEKLTGKDLEGKRYEPLFPYFADRAESMGNFRVCADGYVTSDSGTGIVHLAPAFGEDDYRVCLANGLISKGRDVPCPVNDSGRFTDEVPDFQGVYVKDADNDICANLKGRGRLVDKAVYDHSYPFCWRSDTPLIYRAVPSWFVSVETIKDQLLACNGETYWVPAFVKERRFHNWLADAKDWAISRNRFWGTPIPLWVSEDLEEVVAVGSVEELHQLSGVKVEDLHKESVDHITIPSKQGKGQLKRVEEVFDCWFESGSMPYAQQHYPFENKERFEKGFPADFIAEGLDQTRGWFYTLMVISTALFGKPAFKNLIVNGLVLAGDGKKMSKRLKNYPDPTLLIEKHGADALRLYLVNSPVVRAEPLKFKEEGVHAVVKDVFLPWFNAFRFCCQNIKRWECATGHTFRPDSGAAASSTNVMDVWIQASLQGLIQFVHQEMQAYRLYTVIPKLLDFLSQLTNWYVRLNRPRLKGTMGDQDARIGLAVLYQVLLDMALLMAPLTPFFTEYLYQHLRKFQPGYTDQGAAEDAMGKSDSVHFLMLPDYDQSKLNPGAVERMDLLQTVVVLGRLARERRSIAVKTPVKSVVVVCKDASRLSGLEEVKAYVEKELNSWEIALTTDEQQWCSLKAEPNNKALGKRLGKNFGKVRGAIAKLSHDQLTAFQENQQMELEGFTLYAEDLIVKREFIGDAEVYEACVSRDGSVLVALDTRQDQALLAEGLAREVINRVQKLRKAAGLLVQDEIEVYFQEEGDGTVTGAVRGNVGLLQATLGTVPLLAELLPPHAVEIARDTSDVGKSKLTVIVTRPSLVFDENAIQAKYPGGGDDEGKARFVGGVQTFLSTLDLTALRAKCQKEPGVKLEDVSFSLDGVETTLSYGTDFFFGKFEQLRLTKDDKYSWVYTT